jgi:CIC family chloride channel protein
LVARRVHPESIYTEWLARRGIHLAHGADAALLTRLSVAECFNRRARPFQEDTTLSEMLGAMRQSRQTIYPVIDDAETLRGIVRTSDLRDVLEDSATFEHIVLAGDVVHDAPAVVTPDDSLLTALRRLGGGDLAAVPVVDNETDRRLLGLLTRADLFSAYERALTEQSY